MPASTTTALRSLATSAFIALLSLLSTPGRGLSAEPTPDEQRIDALTHEVQELRTLVRQLEGRIDELEGHSNAATAPGAGPPATVVRNVPAAPAAPAAAAGDLLRGATINAMLDTYYEYNTNDPIGRVNYLRAYDVSSNSFSLNQADLVLESAPQLSAGKRYGVRIDLQFGQATETLQGSLANELRPEIWRNVFQAYGSYVFPIEGEPLQLDFGKWASSIGIEDNYTKDQINYTRSYWYSYLPFYHSGLRASYRINDELTLNYWITNGTQQTEDFNNFKDQLVGFVLTPTPAVVWNFNLYLGQEHPDVVRQNLPTQPGMAFEPIPNAPNGHLQIYDSYATWQATPALLFAAETDLVIDRLYTYSPGARTEGGALYARYQLTPRVAVALRTEYLEDRNGLFSGVPQYLKEGTLTTEYKVAEGFLVRGELRRDASNRAYFLSDTLGLLRSHQDTATLGLLWWIGQKTGPW